MDCPSTSTTEFRRFSRRNPADTVISPAIAVFKALNCNVYKTTFMYRVILYDKDFA